MNSRELINHAAALLEEAGISDAKVDASLLLSAVTGQPALELRLGMIVPDAAARRLEKMIQERLSRRPLQYILGNQPFCGYTFKVDERVLIPRPETELLCEMACAWLKGQHARQLRVLDMCCGSGCIGISIALKNPSALVTLSDISPEALSLTRENADMLKATVNICHSDLFSAVSGQRFDLIVSNPPYIPTEDCITLQPEVLKEPILALDGGQDGLDLYRRIANEAKSFLTPGGRLMLQVGIGEAEAVCSLLLEGGFTDVNIFRDLNGIQRMLSAG